MCIILSFQVFISLKGTKAKINRARLTKKAGSVKSNKGVAFKFSKGTTHMFKIRGPELGDVKSLVMEVRKFFTSEKCYKVKYLVKNNHQKYSVSMSFF